MVFLKNTAIRVGHSIIWSGRYSSRFAAVFHQVSFWLIKLVERAFFSKKFKYSSLIYSHIIINGFERLIFLTIFVYDGLLVGLLYAFYRLIAVSKFFRRFSYLFRRNSSYSAALRQSKFARKSRSIRSSPKSTSDVELMERRPYSRTYYSRFSRSTSLFFKSKNLLYGWRFFKQRFSFLKTLQIQIFQSFRYKKRVSKSFNLSRSVRAFLRFFFQSFFFLKKFKYLYFFLSHQRIRASGPVINFLSRKVFRRSRSFKFYKTALFSSFLTEFFSKLFFFVTKNSRTTQISKSLNYAFINIFSLPNTYKSRGVKLYRTRLLSLLSRRHRFRLLRGQTSFFPLIVFFRKYLQKLKKKYRFYMRNPAFFYSYSSIYFRHKFVYISRRRRRGKFMQHRRPPRRVLPQSKRFFRYYKFAASRMKYLMIKRRKKQLARLKKKKQLAKKKLATPPTPKRDFTSLFATTSPGARPVKKRSFVSFIDRFKRVITDRKQLGQVSLKSNSPVKPLFSTSEPGVSLISKFRHSNRRKLLSPDIRQRILKFIGKLPRAVVRFSNRVSRRRRRQRQLHFRHQYIRFGGKRKIFRKRRRFIKFNAFNFNNLLVSNLYKRLLSLLFRFNLLGRRKLYLLFKTWLRLSFSRLFSFFFYIIVFGSYFSHKSSIKYFGQIYYA